MFLVQVNADAEKRINCMSTLSASLTTNEGDVSVREKECDPGITQCHKAGLLLGCKLTLILISFSI